MDTEYKKCPHCGHWLAVNISQSVSYIDKPSEEEIKKHELC